MKEKIAKALWRTGKFEWAEEVVELAQEIADAVGELPYAVGECERCGFIVAWDKVEEAQIAKRLWREYLENSMLDYGLAGRDPSFEDWLNRREDA